MDSDVTAKTLVVGLDAACWEYLDPLLQSGELPALRRLMELGAWGTLRSTLPALTPTAWASIATGKNPGKHGVFGMMWRRPGTYEFFPTSARTRQGTPFWKHLNDRGVSVGLVNVPFTHPPDEVDGFVVTGFGTPNSASDVTHPPEVLAWIKERFGSFQPRIDIQTFRGAGQQEIFDREREHQARQVELAIQLGERHGVQVLVINLMFLDHGNHFLTNMEQVRDAIRETDSDLDRLIQGFCPDRVMVLSDHGSRRVKGTFLLYNWLLDQGYCAQLPRTPVERSQALNWVLVKWLQDRLGMSGQAEKLVRRITRETMTRLPARLQKPVWQWIERDVAHAREYVSLSTRIDYQRTRLFLGAGPHSIHVNLDGREPSGMVPVRDRQAFSQELVERLSQIADPETGQPLFSGVYVSGELYAGPRSKDAPDIVLDDMDARWNMLEGYYDPISERMCGRYFVRNHRTYGWHSRDGVYVFSGPGFGRNAKLCDGHVMDVPATLLYLYDVPIPEDYDGRVLMEAVDPSFVEQHPVRIQPGDIETSQAIEEQYSEGEAEELLERLRALGYVA